MIRIASQEAFLNSFREFEQSQVQLPPGLKFPLAVKDYLSWVEPSGHRVYLVFEDDGVARGVVFQRTRVSPETPASMCQWCHAVRSGSGVSLLSATIGRDRRAGIYLCSDLNCREHVLGVPSVNDFQEGMSRQERFNRLLYRMREFGRRNLF